MMMKKLFIQFLTIFKTFNELKDNIKIICELGRVNGEKKNRLNLLLINNDLK